MTEPDFEKADDVSKVIKQLIALVRKAPSGTLENIARGDSQGLPGDEKKHLPALQEVIDQFECHLERQRDNHWYPREVIELVSYGSGSEGLWAICVSNALLMISDLESDKFDYMSFRWERSPGKPFFENLPEPFKGPIMAGFDLLLARWERDGW